LIFSNIRRQNELDMRILFQHCNEKDCMILLVTFSTYILFQCMITSWRSSVAVCGQRKREQQTHQEETQLSTQAWQINTHITIWKSRQSNILFLKMKEYKAFDLILVNKFCVLMIIMIKIRCSFLFLFLSSWKDVYRNK
jgi:hypothetical protein